MQNTIRRFIAFAVILAASAHAFGQKASNADVAEKNVRAAMQFLAGDAMQGRGSGTIFERIAAEYVGSQFMQFGLEPAGENGWDGKPSFVQTVTITRNTFAEPPTFRFRETTLTHGKEMILLRANTATASGGAQLIERGTAPRAGATVILRAKEGEDQRAAMAAAQAMITAGASMVLIEETPQMRANWATMAGRTPGFTSTNAKPSVVAVISKTAADEIAGDADGLVIRFEGKLNTPNVQNTWNAIGKMTGSDPSLSSEVILLSSHLDHLGLRENAAGTDKIFNGADDDASGTVAVLEFARVLARGKKPKRTVYFVCFGSEEMGGFGANYFVNNLPFPKAKLVANLEFEMIGRPDDKVKPEELWLTGYERSNLGPELARRGAKLVQDPHPDQNFFQRSDNYTLARQGIIAHTVSSFGLHTDYHRASDEVRMVDFVHMTRAINSMVAPVRWLVNSAWKPEWNPGKNPAVQ